MFFVVFLSFFLFFPSGEGAWAWLKTHINHTTSVNKTPTNSTPYTITHQYSNYLKVLSASPYTSISITTRYLSNSNLNLSSVSAATTFPRRPFHALTTLWVKVPFITTVLTLFFFTLSYSQAVAPGPITVYSVEKFICTYFISTFHYLKQVQMYYLTE